MMIIMFSTAATSLVFVLGAMLQYYINKHGEKKD